MSDSLVRFGIYEFNPASGTLRRDGSPVKLQTQPARVLSVLLARAGDTVTRETLQREVWGEGTHVDFERGLNFCIAQVRSALGDAADSPRYIVTVPKVGYRFIAPVDRNGRDARNLDVDPAAGFAAPADRPDDTGLVNRAAVPRARLARGAAIAVVLMLVASGGWRLWHLLASPPVPTVVVVPFYNETGRPDMDPIAKGIGDATVARLATPERVPVLSVIGNAERLQRPFARADVQQIANQLGAAWVVIGQLETDGNRFEAHRSPHPGGRHEARLGADLRRAGFHARGAGADRRGHRRRRLTRRRKELSRGGFAPHIRSGRNWLAGSGSPPADYLPRRISMNAVTRRGFLKIVPALVPTVAAASAEQAPQGTPTPESFPRQDPAIALEVVGAAHGNVARVQELVGARPALARAVWDWGYGDWETALGAASHVGHKEDRRRAAVRRCPPDHLLGGDARADRRGQVVHRRAPRHPENQRSARHHPARSREERQECRGREVSRGGRGRRPDVCRRADD